MMTSWAGMTGTAETEEAEFYQIYGLEVMVEWYMVHDMIVLSSCHIFSMMGRYSLAMAIVA